MRIRIRCCDNDHKNCNRLKWQGLSCMFQENRWRVIRTEMGRSGSYADPPKHCSPTRQASVGVQNRNDTVDRHRGSHARTARQVAAAIL
jgi:hypothetical protein